jgi:hypothetical protein
VYPRVLQLLAESGEFDVLVSLGDHSGWVEGPVAALYRNVGSDLDRVCSATDVFPCIVSVTTADPSPDDLRFSVESDVPLLKGSPSALRALASRAAYDPPARRRSRARADRVPGRGALSEFESTQLVAGCGIGHANPIRCSGADEAISAANRIGYPVVVKIHNVAHKARVGGVALNLHGDADVRDAVARIGHEVVVAKQVTGGVEVLIGAFRDRDFGPVVAVGVGGTNAEELNLAAIALAPANANDARQLVESVHPLHRLLGGEHIPECLIEAIVGVSEMVARHAEIVEVDVNPLVIHANDAIALDCLVVLDANA